MLSPLIVQWLSVAGFGVIIGCYLALQRGWVTADNLWWNWGQIVGSLLMLVVSISNNSIGLICLQLTWIILTLPKILHKYRRVAP